MRTLTAALLTTLLATPSPIAGAGPGPAPGTRIEALSDALARLAVPETGFRACGREFQRAGAAPQALRCDAPEAAADDGSGFALEARLRFQTPRWYASLAPLGGGGGFVRVHGFGDVAAHEADGASRWTRSSMSFYEDWGLDPYIVPIVPMGTDPVDPRSIASERPFGTGDLTGDGVDDVAVSHYVVLDEATESTSVVTVLDGRTGETRWSRIVPGFVTQVIVSQGTLVLGQETGNVATAPVGFPPNGLDGSRSALLGIGFSMEDGHLEARDVWSVSTEKQWARWLAAEPAGPGLVAAAWMDKPFGAASGTPGHTLLVEAATGAVRWTRDNPGYPRMIRHDVSRDQIVVAEQGDPLVPAAGVPYRDIRFEYTLVGLRAQDGSVASSVLRDRAILLSLTSGDLTGDAKAEWAVGEAITTDLPNNTSPSVAADRPESIIGGRVAAIDPATGAQAWMREARCPFDIPRGDVCALVDIALTYALHVSAGARVLIANAFAGGIELRGLAGATGASLWSRTDDPAYPLVLMSAGNDEVLSVSADLAIRAHDAATGARTLSVPLLHEVHAAGAADVNGDGMSDLIVGSESGGVFALDGTATEPRVLWMAEAAGAIHQLEVIDLDRDGDLEVVVAASRALDVLSAADGSRVWRAAYGHPLDYVFSFTTGDIDGDAKPDVVVPTRTLAAYRGSTGAKLWEFAGTNPDVAAHFSQALIAPDRRVAAEWMTQSGIPFLNSRSHVVVTAIDGPTGEVAWSVPMPSKFGIAELWRSTVIDPDHPCGTGTAMGFTWADSGALIAWHPRLDVYDSATGIPCYISGPLPEGAEHQGTEYLPGSGVVEYNWFNVAQMRPDGVTEVHFDEFNAATSDVAAADLGPLGKVFLKAWTILEAHRPNSPTGVDGDNPAPLAEWGELYTGELFVRDMDGDGADEIVAMPFDWNGYAIVASFAAVGVGGGDYLPHGLAVLEAR